MNVAAELLRSLRSDPWALVPDRLTQLVEMISAGAAENDLRAALGGGSRSSRGTGSGGNIAVIPIHGVMTHRGGWWGGLGTANIRQAVTDAAADPNVKGILLDIDSPGGSVYGTPELAEAVFEARAGKPIWALGDMVAGSAAYWVGSQASKVFVSPSGDVGSIGVWAAHTDLSEAMSKAGVKVTLISAGRYKTEGNPWEPLGKDAQKALQSAIDETAREFVSAVARGRGVSPRDVVERFGDGRMLAAPRALEVGMVDQVASFDQVVEIMRAQLAGRPGTSRRRSAGGFNLPAARTASTLTKADRRAVIDALVPKGSATRASVEPLERRRQIEKLTKDLPVPSKKEKPVSKNQPQHVRVIAENSSAAPWGPTPQTAFGSFLGAVRNAALNPPDKWDSRLRRSASAGTNGGIGSEGGFLIETELQAVLDPIVAEEGQLAGLCRRFDTETGRVDVAQYDESSRASGSRMGGVSVAWRGEGTEINDSAPAWRQTSVKALPMSGLWYCTEDNLADSVYMTTAGPLAFGRELATVLDDKILNGTGVGEPLGVRNSDATIVVSKETGQAPGTIVDQNIVKMWSRVPGKSRRRGAWVVNEDATPHLEILESNRLTYEANMGPFIGGRPVIELDLCPTLGTVGDIVFADLSWYALVWRSLRSVQSVHVRFLYDESAFKFILRANGLPLIASPITPAQGTATRSPFVALETRS